MDPLLTLVSIPLFLAFGIFLRAVYLRPKALKKSVLVRSPKDSPCKTMIVLGSGGHTMEMMQLLKSVNMAAFQPRTYVVAETDSHSESKAIQFEKMLGNENSSKGEFTIKKIPRSRQVGQSWLSSTVTTWAAFWACVDMLMGEMPELIICNGPGSCVPVAFVGYLSKILGLSSTKVVFVESFARVTSMSLSGRLLYPICDRFIVQWPNLQRRYSRAEYYGILV